MSKLKPYIKYQSVQYDYVSQLPENWQLLPNIAVFQERIERGHEDKELLSVTIGRGVIKQSELDKKDSSTLDKSKYPLVYPGDLVYSMRFRQGASGYSIYKGIVSPACTVLRPKKGVEINPRYFYYMFRTGFYKNYVERFAYGIADGQIPLRYLDFKRMYSIFPPLVNQNTIVDYLDRKTMQIQKFISKKERLIELLESQKHTTISTEINKSPIKIKLKFILKIQNGDGIPSDLISTEGEYEVYGGNGVLGYYSLFNNYKETLVIGRVGALCGNVHYTTKKIWVNDNAMFAHTKHDYRYVFYVLKGADLNKLSFANAQPLITGTLVKNKTTCFTIDKTQQIEIVEIIEKKLTKIDIAISKAKSEIEKAKEYKESLITQIVTGQLKVPENAKTNLGENTDLGLVAEPNSEYHSTN
jgi:type I restriction enzyme, S subunit